MNKRKLTPKQKKFIDAYIISCNATDAAIKAGYSKKTARSVGAENLTKPDIQKIISERQQKAADKADFTLEQWIKDVKLLADTAKYDSDKLKALDMLGRHLGAYKENNKFGLDIDSMTDAEVDVIVNNILLKIEN